MAGDQVAEVVARAAVSPLADHLVEPRGGEGRPGLKGLEDEGQVGIDGGGSPGGGRTRQAGPGQSPGDGVGVHPQLAGDGSHPPLLHMAIAQDAGFEFRGDGHGHVL